MKNTLARLVPAVDIDLRELGSHRARRLAEGRYRLFDSHGAPAGLANRIQSDGRLLEELARVLEDPMRDGDVLARRGEGYGFQHRGQVQPAGPG